MKKLTGFTIVVGSVAAVFSSAFLVSSQTLAASCAGVETSIISCQGYSEKPSSVEQSGVWGLLQIAVNILAAGVAVAAVGGLIYGGILYSTAADDASKVQKAIGVIRDVVIGMVAFALMWALVEFLIPGGVFG